MTPPAARQRLKPIRLTIGLLGIVVGVILLGYAWQQRHPWPQSVVLMDPTEWVRAVVRDRLPGVRAEVVWTAGEGTVAITMPLESWATAPTTARGHFLTRATLVVAPCFRASAAVRQVRIVGLGAVSTAPAGAFAERLFDLTVPRPGVVDAADVLTTAGLERHGSPFWIHAGYR